MAQVPCGRLGLGWISARTFHASARIMGREERLYGQEPGHGPKNEVRKDSWLRKRRGPAPIGRSFRLNQGLTLDPFQSYGLVNRSDWRFRDGSPGILSPKQREAAFMMQDLVSEVHQTLKYMKVQPQAPNNPPKN